MAKELEITKRVTRVIKSGDKLLRDVQGDVGQLIAAGISVKEIFDNIRDRFKGPDDKKEM